MDGKQTQPLTHLTPPHAHVALAMCMHMHQGAWVTTRNAGVCSLHSIYMTEGPLVVPMEINGAVIEEALTNNKQIHY